jgi:hypothetical protein
MIKWDWNNKRDSYDYQLLPEDVYSEFLKDKRFLDVTGRFDKSQLYDDNGDLYQILGYYDQNDANVYDSFGFVDPSKIKYARFDSIGNLIDEDYNISYLRKAMNP